MFEKRRWMRFSTVGTLLLVAFAGMVLLAGPQNKARVRGPQLVSVKPLPSVEGVMCELVPSSATTTIAAVFQQRPASGGQLSSNPAGRAETAGRPPQRLIRDTYSAYSAVGVDPVNNEVVLTDENLFQILAYDRMANTPPAAKMTEPKRIIGGLNTKIEFQCGIYVDPKNGDIYAVNNDTVNTLVIYDRNAKGNVPPTRELTTPHGTFGIAVDEEAQEVFLTIQHDSAVVVFNKRGEKEAPPLRLLQGDRTGLADPHGITIDTKNKLMFVSNYGAVAKRLPRTEREAPRRRGREKPNWPLDRGSAVLGSGKFYPPSITVYPLNAQGDTAPVRVIQGPRTRMNMPSHIFMDSERGELYVANDMDHSILVFDSSASGDAAPKRVLKGSRTMIQNPTGLFVDFKNDELWVANFGNHLATVYRRTAEGDTPPLRVIRSGPLGSTSLMIGNPGAVGYDTKREEILVPN
jgi:DNA-binding beta-propeller fold protein YncE